MDYINVCIFIFITFIRHSTSFWILKISEKKEGLQLYIESKNDFEWFVQNYIYRFLISENCMMVYALEMGCS